MARSTDEARPLSTVSTTANDIAAPWPMRIGRACPTMPRAMDAPSIAKAIARAYQGVDVSRKKRAAFSHMSFWVARSPSDCRHAITVSAWSGKMVSGCG